MNAITMLRSAVALLTIAALGGIVMAITRLVGNRNPPSWLALLVLAALVGVVLNQKYQWQAVLLPRGLLVGHALCAAAGFALVVLAAFANSRAPG
jgi:hypothetical protein